MSQAVSLRKEFVAPWVLILLVAFSVPFPIKFNSLVTVGCAAACAVYLLFNRKFDWHFFKTPLFILIATHFIILVLGLFHSPDLRNGFADIERFSFALLFVVLLYEVRHIGITFLHVAAAFTAGCLCVVLYGVVYAGMIADPAQRQIIFHTGHLAFTEIIFIHPLYLSMYMIFIFIVWVDYLRSRSRRLSAWQRAGLLAIISATTLTILFLRSEMGLLSFAIVVVLYPIVIFKPRATFVAFFLFAIALVVYMGDSDRVSNFLDSYGLHVSTALDNRIRLWRGAMEAISMSPFIGAGTGGEQSLLNAGYLLTGYQEGIDNSHNAHNQYFEFIVRNGVLELVVFLALISYNFRMAVFAHNVSALMFNAIFALAMVAECCLNVHKGIVPFYLFSAVFAFLPVSRASKPPPPVS